MPRPHTSTSGSVTRPPTPTWPTLPVYANCNRAKQGTKVAGTRGTSRRLVETAAGAYALTTRCRGPGAICHYPPPARASTSRSGPPQAPRARAPNATSQRRWGGSTPNHPAALRSGMRMGFETPEQHHTIYSQPSGRGRKFKAVFTQHTLKHALRLLTKIL
jgi:hypothetical protein